MKENKGTDKEKRNTDKIIDHKIGNIQKCVRSSLESIITLFPLAAELFEELDRLGIIQKMKDTPHLGALHVEKRSAKSRYDYTILQLHLHQIIRGEQNIQRVLPYAYGSTVHIEVDSPEEQRIKMTVADFLQIFTIINNIGHFNNTFVASKAAVIFAKQDQGFREAILEATDHREVIQKLLSAMDYRHYHLLNSLVVLKNCDQSKNSVKIAQELIELYLSAEKTEESEKLQCIFDCYRTVRNVAYTAFDLQIAKVPFTIDLSGRDSVGILFRELLSEYNDSSLPRKMIESVGKLLDDTVYNEESNTICYSVMSKEMVKALSLRTKWTANDYYDLLTDRDSCLNRTYRNRRDYLDESFLKLTFDREHSEISAGLLSKLEHTNGIRVGYYDRSNGKRTIVLSLKKSCEEKRKVAFHVLRLVTKYLRAIPNIQADDSRFLLATKFFLYYFCDRNPIEIVPTIHERICVLCTKGKQRRVRAVQMLRQTNLGTEDQDHEVENMCNVLKQDSINDVCITLPSSIKVFDKKDRKTTHHEFDGMIIYPNRKEKQIVFLEAKNTKRASRAKRDLIRKLNDLHIPFCEEEIRIQGKDAVLFYDIV